MGLEWNWCFVFGKQKLLWFIPYCQGDAGPIGDGTFFMKQQNANKKISQQDFNISDEMYL